MTDNSRYYADAVVGAFRNLKAHYTVRQYSSWKEHVEIYSVKVEPDGYKRRTKFLDLFFEHGPTPVENEDDDMIIDENCVVVREDETSVRIAQGNNIDKVITLSVDDGKEISSVEFVEHIMNLCDSITRLQNTIAQEFEKHIKLIEDDAK